MEQLIKNSIKSILYSNTKPKKKKRTQKGNKRLSSKKGNNKTNSKKINTLNYCSPRGNNERLTCFSRPSLKRIVKYWNQSYPRNTIEYDTDESRNSIWHKINTKLSKVCDNEYCWVKQPFMSSRSVVLDDYRPEMPKDWKNNNNEWLTTSDIEKVMKQYMRKHNDFFFVGAVPIDFDKKLSPGLCVVNELCKINIKKLLKKKIHQLGIVFNLDPHDKPGSHWVSFYSNLQKGQLYYFDSYGYKPPKQVKTLIDRLIEQGEKNNIEMEYLQNTKRHQYKESECGVYAINFIERMLDGCTFDEFCKSKLTDDYIHNFRDKYFISLD